LALGDCKEEIAAGKDEEVEEDDETEEEVR
jgi:hypothetical protein